MGIGVVILGLLQLVFKRQIQARQYQGLNESGQPWLERFMSKRLVTYILVRCLPLWIVGGVLIIVGFERSA